MLASVVALGVLLAVMAVSRWITRPRAAERVHVPYVGGVVLRPPRRNGILLASVAIIPAITFGALGVGLWARGSAGPGAIVADAAVTLACAAFITWLVVGSFVRRIVVNEAGVERIGVLTRRRVRWEDVASVAYNGLNRWFFLTGKDRTRIWVPEDHDGVGDFAEFALRRLPRAALADPIAKDALEGLAEEAREAAEAARGR